MSGCSVMQSSLGGEACIGRPGRSLGAHSQELEGDAGGPLLVFELPEGSVRADAVRVQRQARHKPNLEVGLALACTASHPGSPPRLELTREL